MRPQTATGESDGGLAIGWRWPLVGLLTAGVLGAALALRTSASWLTPAPVAPPVVHRPPVAPLVIPAHPRVIVFAPHPDDETVGVGGLLARLARERAAVRVVFVTNGDGFPRAAEQDFDLQKPTDADFVALGQLRQGEALAATHQLGVSRHDLRFLGFPDGGLAELWRAHWLRTRPYTSPYTKEDSPPYADAVNTDVDYDGQDLTSVIARELRDFRPTVVVMPHPYDVHPDHVHTSYFVTEALTNLVDRGTLPRPTILTYLVHYPSWPVAQPPQPDWMLTISEVHDTRWAGIALNAPEVAAKGRALTQYKSQLGVMDGFLRRFVCRNELYGRIDNAVLARIASVH